MIWSICSNYFVHTCDMMHTYLLHVLCICVTWLMHMGASDCMYTWDTTHACVWRDAIASQWRALRCCVHTYGTTHVCVWQAYVCHAHVWHGSCMCDMHMCDTAHTWDMTHVWHGKWYMTHVWHGKYVWHAHVWHGSCIHGTWLMCDMAHTYMWNNSCTRVTWLRRMRDMTQSQVTGRH